MDLSLADRIGYATYRIVVYDNAGKIVIVPQDVMSFSFEDIVNGGSGQGTMFVKRSFVDQGWMNYDYRVQLYLNDSIYPWYDGRIVEMDPQQFSSNDEEGITLQLEGWSTQMANAIVSEVLTPSAVSYEAMYNGLLTQFGGTMNADVYLTHLLGTYLDSSIFGSSYIAAMPISLDGFTFDGQALDSCIDAIVKQVLSDTGQIYEWWVRGSAAGGPPRIVIQPQQIPSTAPAMSYYAPGALKNTDFMLEFKNSTIYDYEIQNNSRNLTNMIALYGGLVQNVQIYGSYKDSVSISLYGVRQKKVTNSLLLTKASLDGYGAAYVLQNGYPQPQGSFKKYYADDRARAGQWFQIMEGGVADPTTKYIDYLTGDIDPMTTQNVREVRCIRVLTTMQEGTNRIEQQVFTTAPRPFIDQAFYGTINYIAGRTAAMQGFAGPTQLYYYFMNNNSPIQKPPVAVGHRSDQLVLDPVFKITSVYTAKDGQDHLPCAAPPYSLDWSFSLMDNSTFFIHQQGNIGQLSVRAQPGNCKALSNAFVFDPGTYTLSYQVWFQSGGNVKWSIVADQGTVGAAAYGGTYIYSLPATGTGTMTGTYVNTATTTAKARVLFESLGSQQMSTTDPTLSYVPS